MSGFQLFDLLDRSSSSLFYRETALFSRPRALIPFASPFADAVDLVEEHLGLSLDAPNPSPSPLDLPLQCLVPCPSPIFPLDFFDSAADLIQIDSPASPTAILRRIQERAETERLLRNLSDRVSALELGFDRALGSRIDAGDCRYKWTAEIKRARGEGFGQKYKLMAETKRAVERNGRWTVEIKGKGKDEPMFHTYSFHASTVPAGAKHDALEKVKKSNRGAGSTARVVEIEESPNHRPVTSRKVRHLSFFQSELSSLLSVKAFVKRSHNREKGKKKELSPQDAAMLIQMSYRNHLVWRSQVLRGLRDLAVAKAKLKEIRALFNNFSYCQRIAIDAEERQRFSERIIILLLTVDAIEGTTLMVRAARKSMVEELEAMLDVVDPQPSGKLGSMKRRKFDLPAGGSILNDMAAGVAQVVNMLNHEDSQSNASPDIL
ncbi:BAG family molecular chaperone regulator 7 [Cocos nucifera]|uniref:BAG family molecular chaperone regulator 7 n=1 Tax=Cocos nucifera TaxID=13894 RepID=A0A8K0N4L7_COCNU|nr:BAG family molecular chaperone regulator 7 [Cocos nucifera]